jgi:hypothetical protein
MKEVERIWSENRDRTDQAENAPPSSPAKPRAPVAELKFVCPQCQQRIACDEALGATKMPCPNCQKEIEIPLSPARQIAARLGMDLNTAEDAEMVKRVLLSTEASKIVLRQPNTAEDFETEVPKLLAVCAVAGVLLGLWTAQQPGVSAWRDILGRELWPSQSLLAHAGVGVFVACLTGFALFWITKPIRWLVRVAAKNLDEKAARFATGWGHHLGIALGDLLGAMHSIGATGALLRGRFFEGFFFSRNGERGFLVGGVLGGLVLSLILVLIARFRARRRERADFNA